MIIDISMYFFGVKDLIPLGSRMNHEDGYILTFDDAFVAENSTTTKELIKYLFIV